MSKADSQAAGRVQNLQSWHDDWRGLKVAVLGLGVTGFSVADTLAELGSEVRVITAKSDPTSEQILKVLGAQLVSTEDTTAQLENLQAFAPDLVVVSPGYSKDHALTSWAKEAGVPVWGDIDLGWRLRDKNERQAEWVLVTGTNGKTTTAQLTAHMLQAGGLRAVPVGNIGTPILDALRDPEGFDVLVVEISSFQLDRLGDISPHSSVCLNIADDHLDWHGGRAEYERAKAKVYNGVRVACVYNRQDAATLKMVEEAEVSEGARAVSFGLDTPPVSGLGLVEDILVDRGFHDSRRQNALELTTVAELSKRSLAAPHLIQDVLAAAALARSMGVSPEDISHALETFTLDSHRMQRVLDKDGVLWVDDSKATNAHAADASLKSFSSIVWVVGGLLKGQNLDSLISTHRERLKTVIVIGAERDEIIRSLQRHAPDVPVLEVDSVQTESVMTRVVRLALSASAAKDTVLLSPAAASMDQFESYEDRGNKFSAAVREIVGGGEKDAAAGITAPGDEQ